MQPIPKNVALAVFAVIVVGISSGIGSYLANYSSALDRQLAGTTGALKSTERDSISFEQKQAPASKAPTTAEPKTVKRGDTFTLNVGETASAVWGLGSNYAITLSAIEKDRGNDLNAIIFIDTDGSFPEAVIMNQASKTSTTGPSHLHLQMLDLTKTSVTLSAK